MKTRGRIYLIAAVLFLVLAGCEETAKRTLRVHPPETAVTPPQFPGKLPVNRSPLGLRGLSPRPPAATDVLMRTVGAAFRSAEEDYKSGHFEKAIKNLDSAVASMRASGLDVKSDPRLKAALDKLVYTMHSYELAASRANDALSESRAEPAPIDEIAEVTLPADPTLKARVAADLPLISHDLPLTVNDPVTSYLHFFQTTRGRAIVEGGLRRAGNYREMISRVLREEGLPQDLIYLAQAESGFRPLALSRARALGMWQFMLFRGREYGLRRTWWVDERQDPEKATRAAARHLRDLYALFGDWYLALSAYNSGPGKVQRAIERTGYADFWELYKRNVLPRETKNYVPIILALTLVAKDAPRYGIAVQPEPPIRHVSVRPGHPIDLRLVADTIDVSVEVLKALNPQLLRLVTPSDAEFELHLPEGTAGRFMAEIASIAPDKWVGWRRRRVEEGDTLSAIARKYRTDVKTLAAANKLESGAPVQAGDNLLIPAMAASPGQLVRYKVRRGDTLPSIAEQYSVTPADLQRWNNLRADTLARGVSLRIYPGGKLPASARGIREVASSTRSRSATASAGAPHAAPASKTDAKNGAAPTIHLVQAGESLWSIAQAYQTTVGALRRANQFLASRELRPGDQVRVQPPK